MADRPPFTTMDADVRDAVAYHIEHGGWAEHNSSGSCRCAGCRLVWTFAGLDRTRVALDDMWSCIAKPEIDQLQPETVEVAKDNHERLWH